MNEEDVKIKLIVPWLQNAGVHTDDLNFESHFSVRLGRQSFRIGSERPAKIASGHSDILVKNGEKNLLVIETKPRNKTLSTDDRDQAISYARLLDQIAPYAVVTNGAEWEIYNAVTKDLIEPSSILVDGFEIHLPEEDIADAQAIFLRLNENNLQQFCSQQVEGQLQHLKGSILENKKYVSELHVKREGVWKEVHRFLESDLPAVILTAQSGWGKSCEVSAIAEDLLIKGKPVFFFNGTFIGGGLLQAIAEEFEWHFDEGITPIRVFKRIDRLSRGTGCVIVVDAIDEWDFHDRHAQLSNLLSALKNRNIKLVLSCKNTVIDSFLRIRGTPTEVQQSAQIIEISSFTDTEFRKAISRYRKVYAIDNSFEKDVFERAKRDPFLLRILFDVAKESGTSEFRFDSRTLFERYLRQLVTKTADPDLAIRTIIKIAECIFDKNSSGVSEEVIRLRLGLSINEPLMKGLFEFGLLVRTDRNAGDSKIEFYFQQLRDFVIAFWVLKLDNIADEKLKSILENEAYPSVRGDVFTLFYRLTSIEQKSVIDGSLRRSATIYLDSYIRTIEQHFPMLTTQLNLGNQKQIGFIAELLMPGKRFGFFALRQIENNDGRVEFLPISTLSTDSNELSNNWRSKLISNSELQLGNCAFRDGNNIRQFAIEDRLLPEIYTLVEEGNLNVSNNIDILTEIILGTVIDEKDIFGSIFIEHSQNELPKLIGLSDVENCLLKKKLDHHFSNERINQLIEEGIIHVSQSGRHLSYSHTWSNADFAWIKGQVDKAVASGVIPSDISLDVDLDKIDKLVNKTITQLRDHGIEQLDTMFLDHPVVDLLDGKITNREVIGPFLCDINDRFQNNYQTLLDSNFPTLKSMLPNNIEATYSTFMVIDENVNFWGRSEQQLIVYRVKSGNNPRETAVVNEADIESNNDRRTVKIFGKIYQLVNTSWTTVRNFCMEESGLKNSNFRYMPMRSYSHSRILKELSQLNDSQIVEVLQNGP